MATCNARVLGEDGTALTLSTNAKRDGWPAGRLE